VEELNNMALSQKLDVTKVSYHTVGYLLEDYCLLGSGGAIGRGCGPLVVAKDSVSMESLREKRIAIPGQMTTAFLLLCLYEPSFKENAIPMPFYRIMESVKAGEVDAGLIIHEGRFTYPSYGLKEIMDLGAWWEETTGMPIPLGGIVARRTLGEGRLKTIEDLISRSIRYAHRNRRETLEYIRGYAQEMSEDVINQHIDLYVNDFSLDIGEHGSKAIERLITEARDAGLLPLTGKKIFCC
jgi:1,4-dihydroxy-6-naphthoate synthase